MIEKTFEPAKVEAAVPPDDRASATGSGAIAQAGGTGVGAGGVHVEGGNTGDINTGTQVSTGGGAYVGGNVNAGGDFIGRDKIVEHQRPAGQTAAGCAIPGAAAGR